MSPSHLNILITAENALNAQPAITRWYNKPDGTEFKFSLCFLRHNFIFFPNSLAVFNAVYIFVSMA